MSWTEGSMLCDSMKNVLDEFYTTTKTLEMKFLEALFIVAGDFKQANLKRVLPKYHLHIICPTRGPSILDHFYRTIKGTYHFIPHPHFGKSHHHDTKTKELIIDFRKKGGEHAPIHINGLEVGRCNGHDGTTMPLLPQATLEIWHVHKNRHQLLQLHHRKHAVQKVKQPSTKNKLQIHKCSQRFQEILMVGKQDK
eukprot:g47425.t1